MNPAQDFCSHCGQSHRGLSCAEWKVSTRALRQEGFRVLREGETLGGLQILRPIGQGAMGQVYLARQESLGRTVAVKVLPPGSDEEAAARGSRFEREAHALASLAHPNIVVIHEFGREGDLRYFVMEHMEGGNLRQRLRPGGLPIEEVRSIFLQVLSAVEAAHARGIVHRDLKPENILMTGDGTVKIADFGLAKLVGPATTLTRGPMCLGTPAYMPPEQMTQAGEADERADIYSLGAILYEMATGKLPVGQFLPPSKHARVPSGLDDVVGKALRSDRQERYGTVAEFREAFRKCRERRRWGLAAALSFVGIAAILLGVYSIPRLLRRHPPVPAPDLSFAYEPEGVLEHEGGRKIVALAVAGDRVAAGTVFHRIQFWDRGQPQTPLEGHRGEVFAVRFSPDGKALVSGGRDRTLRIWSIPDGKPKDPLEVHRGAVTCLAFSQDGRYLASGSEQGDLLVHEWPLLREVARRSVERSFVVYDMAWCGTKLAVATADGPMIWDPWGTQEVRYLHKECCIELEVSADGSLLAESTIRDLRLWDTASWTMMHAAPIPSEGARALAIRPDGKLIALGGPPIRIWDVGERKLVGELPGHTDRVTGLQFSSDGRRLYSCSLDTTVRTWKVVP